MDISFSQIGPQLGRFLRRYHFVIFVVGVIGGLGFIVFLLYGVIVRSTDTSGYVSPNSNTAFDQKTIQQITTLGTNSAQNDKLYTDGPGRKNPFVE